MGRLWDPVARRPEHEMMGRSGNVGHICFLSSTQKHIKLTLANYSSELW